MQLGKIANRVGFTKTEFTVIFFLVFFFFTGMVIKFFGSSKSQVKTFDYTISDSLFYAADSISEEYHFSSLEKDVDYKGKVLDFNSDKFQKVEKKSLPGEKSINLNEAGLQEFMNLPGIGEKTAQKIMEYRNQIGKFKSIDQLKEVKGIQAKKIDQIKNYIFIE